MAIKGSLTEASLADVVQLLALGFKTGCLSITDRTRFGQIYFERGRVIFARIVNRRDRIGDVLVREGTIEGTTGFTAWMSDDADRVPLEVRIASEYGEILIELVEYRPPPRDPHGQVSPAGASI